MNPSPKRKYPDGTVLMPSRKALRLHPDVFTEYDRFLVTGVCTAVFFRTADSVELGRSYKAGEIIHDHMRRVHDSYVVIDHQAPRFSIQFPERVKQACENEAKS